MFSALVRENSLIGDIADTVFKNIKSPSYNGDYSLATTMRFLLYSRLPEDVKMNADVCRLPCNHNEVNTEGLTNRFFLQNVNVCTNSLLIMPCSGSSSDIKKVMEIFGEEFIRCVKEESDVEFRELLDLRKYTQMKINCDARYFICEQEKSTLVVISELDVRNLHFIESFLPRLMPWWFADKPLTADEISLLKGLQQKYPTLYYNAIEKFASTIDFRSTKIRSMLGGFERKCKQAELTTAKYNLGETENNIRSNLRRYSQLIEERTARTYRVVALETMLKQSEGKESEFVDFCIKNKCIDPISIQDTSIIVVVKDYLDMVDPDMYETMASNPQSHLWHEYGYKSVFADVEDRKTFLDALFSSEAQLKILGCSVYMLDIKGTVDCFQDYEYPKDCDDRIANPHIHYYSCLGDYSRLIREDLLNGDIVGALQQCIASCKSINIGEGVTIRKLFNELFTTDKKCIELPDGSHVTPEAALNWLQNN